MLIKVKVITESKFEKVVKKTKSNFEIHVKQVAENNLANKRVLELVRDYFKARLNDNGVGQVYNGPIRIVNGHHSPNKIISLDKLSN